MKNIVIISIFILFAFVANAQVDTLKSIPKVNAHGYAYKNLQADSSFGLPKDTFRLKSTWRGMAFKGAAPYYWDGNKWNSFSTGGSTYTFDWGLLESSDTVKADSSKLITKYQSEKSRDSLGAIISGKVNISDTATMLAPYLIGSGTTNNIPRFTGTRTLGNSSLLYDNGTNAGTTAKFLAPAFGHPSYPNRWYSFNIDGNGGQGPRFDDGNYIQYLSLSGYYYIQNYLQNGVQGKGFYVGQYLNGTHYSYALFKAVGNRVSFNSLTDTLYKYNFTGSSFWANADTILAPNIPNNDTASYVLTINENGRVQKELKSGLGGGGADGYVDGGSFNTTTNKLTLTQAIASDVDIYIPPSYLLNPQNADSLLKAKNDSVTLVKAVTVTSANSKLSINTTRTDTTLIHQITVNEANFTGIPQSAVTNLVTDLAGKQASDADLTALAALSGTNNIYYRSGANTWSPVTIGSNLSFSGGTLSASGGGGGLSDGDYGDITVGGTGTTMTIDNDVVTFAKMQNISTKRLLGRLSSGTGDVEQLDSSQVAGFVGLQELKVNTTYEPLITTGSPNILRSFDLIAGTNVTITKTTDTDSTLRYTINASGGSGSGTVNTGAANTLAYYPSAGTTVDDLAAITANRALISDANGLPIASSVTNTELGYVSGVTSAIQTQLDAKIDGSGAANRVAYFSDANTLTTNANFTFDGSALKTQYVEIKDEGTATKFYNNSSVTGNTSGLLFTTDNGAGAPSGSVKFMTGSLGMEILSAKGGTVTRMDVIYGTNHGYLDNGSHFSIYPSAASQELRLGAGGTENLVTLQTDGDVGINATTPAARLHVVKTTEQVRVGYDGSNYFSTTVSSTGSTTFDLTGTSPEFTFSDAVNVPDEAYGSGWNGNTEVPTKNAIYDKIESISVGTVQTYTPTLTNTTNIAASSANVTYYRQIGDVVDVWGELSIDATSASTISELGMSLPVASTFSHTYDLSGTSAFEDNTAIQIKADVSNSRAVLRFTPQSASDNKYNFHFTYYVIIP